MFLNGGLLKNLNLISNESSLFMKNPDDVLDELNNVLLPESANLIYLDFLFNQRLNFIHNPDKGIEINLLLDEKIYLQKYYESPDSVNETRYSRNSFSQVV